MNTVTYQPIPGFPGYRAGSDGTVWSCWRSAGRPTYSQVMGNDWKQLKPDGRPSDGRKRYTLRREDGKYRRAYGSYFVLIAFVGSAPEGTEACHENGDCTDDAIGNLRWDTHSANLLDRRRHGTNVEGEKVNTAKLTVADVLEIRRAGRPLRRHAERYGVSEALVSAILKRKVWKHV